MFTLRQRPEQEISQCDGLQLSFSLSFFLFSCEAELRPGLAVELVTQLEMLIVRHARCHLGQRQPPPVPPCHPSSRLRHRGGVASVTVTCLSVESDSCPSDASNLARRISVCAQHAATPISPAEGDGQQPKIIIFFFFFFSTVAPKSEKKIYRIQVLFSFLLAWPEGIKTAGAELERCFGEPAHGAHVSSC